MTTESTALHRAVEMLRNASRVCCMTGAGVSAESGIATFRGPDGQWYGRRPEDVATPEAFQRDPALVWEFYHARRQALAKARPNPGHYALAELERIIPNFQLVTQNVDGLHHAAGSRHVIELHGNLAVERCSRCEWTDRVDLTTGSATGPPTCDQCGAFRRPGVVWFGEMLPEEAMTAAQSAARDCQVMLVVGTSSVVQPAASLAEWASMHGAKVIEVNIDRTEISTIVDLRLVGPSGEVLPLLVERVKMGLYPDCL